MSTTVWIVDDDSSIRWVLERALNKAGFHCELFVDGETLLDALQQRTPHIILSDIKMPGIDGLSLIDAIHRNHAKIPIIIMTAHSDLDSAVNAYQRGAFEYLPKPFDLDEAIALLRRAEGVINEQQSKLTSSPPKPVRSGEIIGEASAMQEVFRAIGRLARSSISVLINGQSGTGKELIAHALHRHSPRAEHHFIALNMAAIPKDLIESELFGHEKGAFTGANTIRRGRFEQADGGTLFLDEIGDMPLDIQTRLLRVLADGQFYRVGGHQPLQVDVRIIAATHQHLERLVEKGAFREDLFHRLNVIRIHLPSLKERREDIPKLAQHFLSQAANELNAETKILHPDTLTYLQQLPWPGNVRQLENLCRWLTVMAAGQEVLLDDLPSELRPLASAPEGVDPDTTSPSWQGLLKQWAQQQLAQGETAILTHTLPQIEQIILSAALEHSQGRKQEAAHLLGWGRNTLTRKMKQLDLP